MTNSHSSHPPESEGENDENAHSYPRVKTRVFFVRHGRSTEDTGWRESMPQSSEAPLCDIGKEQMQASGAYLKRAWVQLEEEVIFFSDDTIRVVESVQLMTRQLVEDAEIIPQQKCTEKLRTTEKWLNGSLRILENTEVFADTVRLMEEVRQRAEQYSETGTGFILVGHKSNRSWVIETTDNTDEAIDISFDIENGEIIERDINMDTWEYIDPRKHPESLFLNRKNYETVIKALKHVPELTECIEKFDRNHGERSILYPIWELQNDINTYFHSHTEAFTHFLTNPDSPTSLRTFCLANLIAQKDYDTIEEYYLYDSTYISKEEKEIFFQNTQDADMKAILRILFVSRYEDFWKDHNPEELRTRLGEDFYTLLQSNQTSHAKAMELQKLSLDEMILAKESEAILPRHVYYLTKSDSDPQKENEVSLDFRKIWESWDKYLLRAHVGQGKSFWLTEFVKYAAIRGRTVIFYQAKDLWQIKDQGEIKRIFDDAEAQWAILCIDAIDEIAERGIKTYIKECIDRFSGACVVTARESEYPGTNQGFVTLAVKPMDSNAFLESRFLDQDDALEKVRSILQENHLDREVEGNPLLLTLVVLLAKMDTDDKGEYSKLGIKPLDDIRNKADLYESIVRFILTKHSKGIKGQSYTRKDLDRWVDELGVYAYEMFSQNGFPTVDETDAEDFDTHLSLLFQKTQDHQYDFIHKSFYEFFLARHLLERGDGNEEIYRFRNACAEPSVAQWNEWRDFRPVVMFYGEMLANNWNIDTLKQFLGEKWLLEYDDIFGENFFMGLEILYTWPEEERSRDPIRGVLEKYIKKVRKWDIEEVIKKFELVKSLSKNIGYVDTEVFKEIISHLLKTFSLKIINESVQWYNYETISRLIAEIWTPEAIYEAAEKADKIWIGNKVAQRIYLSIIEIQTPEAIRVAVKGAETAIERKRFWGSVELYCTIARIWTSEAMQAAAKGAETLVRKWGGYFLESTISIYEEIARIWTSEAMHIAAKGAEILLTQWSIAFSEEKIDDAEIKARKLIETKEVMNFFEALQIYKKIVRIWSPIAIQKALDGSKLFMEKEWYKWVGWIYQTILEVESSDEILKEIKRGMNEMIKRAEKLIKEKRYGILDYDVIEIYEAIAEIWTPEAIQEAMSGMEEFIKKEEWLLRDRTIRHAYWRIKENLNPDITKKALKTEEIRIVQIYRTIAEIGTPEAIWEVTSSAEVLTKLGKLDEALFIRKVILAHPFKKKKDLEFWFELYKPIWSTETILEAVKRAEDEKTSPGTKKNIYAAIAEIWTPEAIHTATKGAEKLLKVGCFDVQHIYMALGSLPAHIPVASKKSR